MLERKREKARLELLQYCPMQGTGRLLPFKISFGSGIQVRMISEARERSRERTLESYRERERERERERRERDQIKSF